VPTSFHHTISKILDLIIFVDPKSVLDIGVGFGKYGMLCREYLEVWGRDTGYGSFTRVIDGVEAFPQYLTPLHSYVYNKVYQGDARDVIGTLPRRYDLVILIDVLEHFTKPEGTALVHDLLRRNGMVLVSTPKEFMEQHDTFENPFETHLSHWSKRDFRMLGPGMFLHDRDCWIVLLGEEASMSSLKRSYFVQKYKQRLARLPLVLATYHAVRRWARPKNA